MPAEALRIDKFLWHIRLFKSRSLAQVAIEQGHIRINGERAQRAHLAVHIGDVITLPRGEGVMALRILAIPLRRGPAAEAQGCYVCL
jgi:ribosome-associated heat shock protein Hsp15